MPFKDVQQAKEYNTSYKREWRRANREREHETTKAYRLANPEKQKLAGLKWRQNNPEQYLASCKRQEDKRRGTRTWNLEERRQARQRRRGREASVKINDLSIGEWEILKDEFGYLCAYCGQAKKLEQDHIIAVSKGGNYTYTNIVPACKSCNSSKGDIPVDVFLDRRFNAT